MEVVLRSFGPLLEETDASHLERGMLLGAVVVEQTNSPSLNGLPLMRPANGINECMRRCILGMKSSDSGHVAYPEGQRGKLNTVASQSTGLPHQVTVNNDTSTMLCNTR